MLLAPVARLLPFTVRDATAFVPDAARVPEPSVVLPSLNVRVPVGETVPLEGVTVTLSTVLPLAGILVTLAARAVVVLTVTGATVTINGAEVEAAKPVLPK